LKGIQPSEYLADLGVAHAPVQASFFLELLAPRGVLGAHKLHRGAAHGDAVALAEPGCELLQLVATEPLMALADGAAARFVAKVEDLVDLARHRAKHFGVLVLDAQLKGLDRFHGKKL
jgi:hypothetical protein